MRKYTITILSSIVGFFVGAHKVWRLEGKEKQKIQAMSDKHLELFLMMNQWVEIKQKGKRISDYLEKNGYKNIAIYGMSYVGERLLYELEESSIIVKYGIDKKADEVYSDIKLIHPDNYLEEVDAVIVTSVFFMKEIENILVGKISCPIISLKDILYEL